MSYVDGERVYRCLVCRDDGLVIVWHWRSMIAMRKWLDSGSDKPFTGPRYSCGVRCNCPAAQRWSSEKVFFSDVSMCPCDYHPSDADVATLQDHIINEGAGTPWTGTDGF